MGEARRRGSFEERREEAINSGRVKVKKSKTEKPIYPILSELLSWSILRRNKNGRMVEI